MKAALAALRYMLDNGADEKLLQEVGTTAVGWRGELGCRLAKRPELDPAVAGECRGARLRSLPATSSPAALPRTALVLAPGFLARQGAQLAQACLSFDFVGTLLDDSAEDVTTIQVGGGGGGGWLA
jgi:hypothetical protein